MRKIITLIQQYATGRLVLLLFGLTMGIYAVMLLYSIPAVVSAAPDMKLFDMSPAGYSPGYAARLLEAIGPEGRSHYLSIQLPLDFVYPGLFALTYTLLMVWLFRKSFDDNSKIFYLSLVPIFAGLFDYLENIGIIAMLRTFPEVSPQVVKMASMFTILKSGFTIIFYILLIAGLIFLAVGKIKKA